MNGKVNYLCELDREIMYSKLFLPKRSSTVDHPETMVNKSMRLMKSGAQA
jgi:hypothetical protein